jgi:hypothetical protein
MDTFMLAVVAVVAMVDAVMVVVAMECLKIVDADRVVVDAKNTLCY